MKSIAAGNIEDILIPLTSLLFFSFDEASITFYGGVHEILIEDKGTRIFLDFGMQMGKVNQYFKEFVNPRTSNGMGDLFEFELLPKLKGLYRKDYSEHIGFYGNEENEISAVILQTNGGNQNYSSIFCLNVELQFGS